MTLKRGIITLALVNYLMLLGPDNHTAPATATTTPRMYTITRTDREDHREDPRDPLHDQVLIARDDRCCGMCQLPKYKYYHVTKDLDRCEEHCIRPMKVPFLGALKHKGFSHGGCALKGYTRYVNTTLDALPFPLQTDLYVKPVTDPSPSRSPDLDHLELTDWDDVYFKF